MSSRSLFVIVVLGLAAAGFAYYGGLFARKPAESVADAKITTPTPAPSQALEILIDWQAEPTYLGIYFAKSKGYFSQLGYTASVIQSWGANQAVASVAAGRYVIGTASGGATVLGFNNGAKVVSLGVLYQRVPSVIYGLASKRILKPSDLKGKRIGIYPGSITSNEFDAFLKVNHMSRKDMQIVSLSGADIPLLMADKIDAVLHYTEMSPVLVENDSTVQPVNGRRTFELRLSDYGVVGYGLNIIAARSEWDRNSSKLVLLAQAIERGYRDGCQNRAAAVDAFVAEFPQKDRNYVRQSWDKVCALVGDAPGAQDAAGWQETIDLYRDLGLLTVPVTPLDILGK